MNWKILTIPAAVFSSSVLLTAACEPCEEDQCSFSDGLGGEESGGTGGSDESGGTGSGASDSGGSNSGGTGTGGTAGEGGSSGGNASGGEAGSGGTSLDLDCQEDGSVQGSPGSCEPVSSEGDDNYACEACVQQFCCTEFEACNANSPVTACRFGSTLLDGTPMEGEFDCMLGCLRNLEYAIGDAYDVETCAADCGSAECDEDSAGPAASSLISCMLGIGNDDYPLGCQEACQMLPE